MKVFISILSSFRFLRFVCLLSGLEVPLEVGEVFARRSRDLRACERDYGLWSKEQMCTCTKKQEGRLLCQSVVIFVCVVLLAVYARTQ